MNKSSAPRFEVLIRRRQRGATQVEFALTIIAVVFVFFLLFEFSMWIYCYNVMADAAKAGVRYAIVHGSKVATAQQSGPNTLPSPYTPDPDCTKNSDNVDKVTAEVTKWANFSVYPTSGMNVTVCYLDGTNAAPNRVQVKISNPVVPFFGNLWSTAAITARAEGRIVD